MKQVYKSDNAPKPLGPYSQAIEANGFVFLAGQIPIEPKTNQVVTGNIESQARQVMENIKAVLTSANMTFHQVVKSTIFLTDLEDFNTVNTIYAQYFSEAPPARTTIQVAALPKAAKVEIEMIAAR